MSAPGAENLPECFRGPEAQALLEAGHTRSLPALSLLCEEGQVTDCFFLVTAGEFVLAKRIAGCLHSLSTFGPGSVLALMPALDGAPCAVSICALNDATVVEIKRSSLLALLGHDSEPNLWLANLLSLLAIRRLRGATNELAQALYSALRTPDCTGHIDAVRLARIQAGSYAWLGS